MTADAAEDTGAAPTDAAPRHQDLGAALDRAMGSPGDPTLAAGREVAGALRLLIDHVMGASVTPDVAEDALRSVLEATDALRPYAMDAAARANLASSHPADEGWRYYERSPQAGPSNPVAPPLRVSVEGDTIVGVATFGLAYQGPPGAVHGGAIAAAFDEVLGLTQALSGFGGFTAQLDVSYRRLTPLDTETRFEGRVEGVEGRKLTARGRLLTNGQLTAEATALFVRASSAPSPSP